MWQTGRSSPDQGPAIGSGEVARLLAPETMRDAEAAFHAESTTELSEQAARAAEELASDPGWIVIRHSFGLTPDEGELLGLLLAVEMDPGLSRVIAYLHDDARMNHPTPWIAARLAGWEPSPFVGQNLRRWLLASPHENAAPEQLTTAWHADAAAAHAVFSGVWRDSFFASAAVRTEPAEAAAFPCLHPPALAALMALADPRDSELAGPPGIGKQTLAAQYAASVGAPLLAVDLQALAESSASSMEALTRTLREAKMTGALAYFRNAEAARQSDWTRARTLGVRYLRGVRHPTGEALPITLAPLPIEARLDLWRGLTAESPPDALIMQRLTPSEIVRVAKLPRRAAAAVLRQHRRRPDHALLTSLPTPYEWDDLVLPPDVDRATARLREPGAAALDGLRGMGLRAADPSRPRHRCPVRRPIRHRQDDGRAGDGASLGLDLLRVDLAGVVNKYIGETEKKLREVFDACEDSGALLFFDEADALFGNRTQVKDAHDRFANIEIDYLLQRIERFDGVAILATNRRQDLDPAFVRRLRFVIEFLPPRPEERLALWRRALPPQCAERRDHPRRDRLRLSRRAAHHDRRRDQEHRAGAAFLARARARESACAIS